MIKSHTLAIASLALIPFSLVNAEKEEAKKEEKPGGRCCTVLPKGEIKDPVFIKQDTKKKRS